MADWKLLENRPIDRDAGRVICVANQKGGVAKTTTAVNLGAALALRGHRTLVVDIDPQSNATTGVGIDHRRLERSTYDLLSGEADLAEVITPTEIKRLDCAPASLDLAGAEIELAGMMARERKLSEALAGVAARYEVVFVDCPPSLGLLTVNALAAAQDLLVPVQCEYYALEGLGQLMETAERVRRSLNAQLRIGGFLLTMYDGRTKLSAQVAEEVRSHFGDLVYATVVPRSVRLSEAPSFGEPVLTLDPSSSGAVAYRLLAAEVEKRYGLEVHIPPPPAPRGARKPKEESIVVEEQASPEVVGSTPGPHGRGYGTTTPIPEGVERSYPRSGFWGVPR